MLGDIDGVYGIDKLKIMNFKGLSDFPMLEFNLMNVIVSPGNFGKTSVLMAVAAATDFESEERILKVAESFKGVNGKTFENFKKILKASQGNFLYEIKSEFSGFELYKRLCGRFFKNKFFGEYFSHITNDRLCMNNKICKDFVFGSSAKDVYSKKGVCSLDFAYFDFSGDYNCKISGYKHKVMKNFIEDYIFSFDDNVQEIFVKKDKFYIKHKNFGECSCDILGSALVKCLEFSDFCDKNSKKMLLIDNADSVVSPMVYDIFIKMMLAHFVNTESQFFVTARDREFGRKFIETVKKAGLYNKTSFINIYRDNDKISVENTVGAPDGTPV